MRIANVEIKIDKKFFIKLGIIVILCFASFCAGRFIRFRGVSGTSEQLVDGIVLSRETADKLADELNLGGSALKSGIGYEQAILEGIGTLRRSNKLGQECLDLLKKEIEENKKLNESTISLDMSNIYNEFDIAIEQAERYEQLLKTSELIILNE